MTRLEAKNAAKDLGNESNPKLSSCVASELYDFGQGESFKTILSNGVECKTPEDARRHAVHFFVDRADRICKKLPPLIYSMTCWDGSLIEPYDPCFKCPPPPF